MKLFWGLIETTPKHQHTFDASMWELAETATISENFYGEKISKGAIHYYQNTCTTCGDLVEHELSRTI
jgi:hypothetical protein